MKKVPTLNFIPKKYLDNKIFAKQMKIVKYALRSFSLILLGLLVFNIVGISVNAIGYNATLSPEIEKKYNETKIKVVELKIKKDSMEKAEYEYFQYDQILDMINNAKPDDIKFTKIDIKWDKVTINGVGEHVQSFNRFAENLQKQGKMFEKVMVDRMESEKTGNQKTFTLSTTLK
ncbi:MAG: PilN domain-containing protein [Patescibacteria group bacterium]|jgi:Tfp pilus assembly protein PilN